MSEIDKATARPWKVVAGNSGTKRRPVQTVFVGADVPVCEVGIDDERSRSLHPSLKGVRMKTIYCLRIRMDESQPWGETEYYRTRKERDQTAAINRIIGGIRTHSFEEKQSREEIDALTL